MPNVQITQRDLATGSVSQQRRDFNRVTGKSREARVFFLFATANVPEAMPHALGRIPTGFKVVSVSAASGAPGVVYAPITGGGGAGSETDASFNFTRNYITLACSTADTWAEVLVF